jgi:hypothetical protein
VVGMVNDEMRKYETEVERRGMTAPGGMLSGYSSPTTPAAPLEQQIREVSEEVIRWAERLAERRRCSEDVARALHEAEEHFSERSIRLTQLMGDYRAAGNAPKQAR